MDHELEYIDCQFSLSNTYTPSQQAIVYRGADGVHAQNYAKLYNDVAAAYALGLR